MRSARSRAPGAPWSSFSGSAHPSAEAPVRMTSLGCVPYDERDAAQRLQLRLVACQLGARRQVLVDQEVGDLLELRGGGDLEDVVAAVVQVVAGAPDGAQRGVARGHSRKRDRLLRPEGR